MPTSRRLVSLLATVVLAGSLTACTSGDDEPDDATDPTPTPPPPVLVSVDLKKVAGEGLRREARQQIGEDVQALLQGYVDAAFLGDYPRDGFADALKTFTKGAAEEARRDLELLTGAGLGDVQSVVARRLDVELSVLAPRGKPAGGTAKVRFDLDVDGTSVVYTGRLMLTTTKDAAHDAWKIFGYELRRNDKREG